MDKTELSKYEKIINKGKKIESNSNIKSYLVNLSFRCLSVIIILVTLSIIYKSNNILKENITNYFFKEDISFIQINKIYDKYLGGLLPIYKTENTTAVFNEKLDFSDSSIYYDGVKLFVSENYLVPAIEEGMVVFIGEKENYGRSIIVENLDGIDYWYCNINNTSLKLYDYVEKGSLLGEVNNELYMVFSKDGNYLNYEEYIY